MSVGIGRDFFHYHLDLPLSALALIAIYCRQRLLVLSQPPRPPIPGLRQLHAAPIRLQLDMPS